MNKAIGIGAGALAGVGLGSVAGNLATLAMNKALIKRISSLDEELDNSLSEKQLALKSKLEKRSFDLDLTKEATRDYIVLELEVLRMKREFLGTLRPNQLIIYNKLNASTIEYQKRTKNLSRTLMLLGGLAGGIIVSKLN